MFKTYKNLKEIKCSRDYDSPCVTKRTNVFLVNKDGIFLNIFLHQLSLKYFSFFPEFRQFRIF